MGNDMATQNDISATLKFTQEPEFRTNLLREKLTRAFLEADISVFEDRVDDGGLQFSNRDMVVRVRPTAASIVVSVTQAPNRRTDAVAYPAETEADERYRRVTCFHAVRTLQKILAPRSIDWSDVRHDSDPTGSVYPRRPQRAKISDQDRLEIMVGSAVTEDARFGGGDLEVGRTHQRLDQSFEVAQAEMAVLDEVAPDVTSEPDMPNRATERFPELMPAERTLREERSLIFPSGAIELRGKIVQDESTNPTERAEAYDLTARLTVYVFNLIILIAAFPVGFALLVYNILGGENVRTTAHVLSLTGLGSVIMQTGAYQPIFTGF